MTVRGECSKTMDSVADWPPLQSFGIQVEGVLGFEAVVEGLGGTASKVFGSSRLNSAIRTSARKRLRAGCQYRHRPR